MAALSRKRLTDIHKHLINGRTAAFARLFHSTRLNQQNEHSEQQEGEFRVFEIEGLKPVKTERFARRQKKKPPPPRFRSMATDQDWTDVWPTASTFKWSAVPFPVRQGFVENSSENEGVVPAKYANLELMKPPNFLHLTPAHVKKHCDALKKFCTAWPEGLETEEDCRHHFPVESVTSDYVFAAPSLRDDRARVASIKLNLSDLELDYHSRDKFIRLVGDRYNPDTDEVIFESDRCPLKSQNLEYVNFLLTAVYFESWKREGWEDQKELSDMESYFWDINASRKNMVSLLRTIKEADEKSPEADKGLGYLPSDVANEDAICQLEEVQQYKVAVEELFNEGENIETLNNYKAAVTKLLNLKSDAAV
ncbi:28S ribosomal protein S35, mitochondrial [Aplysia californica]|uniref:28S ribosomal protein S35, mitochondrial n=1 Tax=Aplysia californica TaxID=6500 RepID=A0ABM0JD11_APLCA|nr:28S ribosomal protein S35, mitochondrial [Aplysia californica]